MDSMQLLFWTMMLCLPKAWDSSLGCDFHFSLNKVLGEV